MKRWCVCICYSGSSMSFLESGYKKQKVYYESISERYPRLDDVDCFGVCTCVISAFRI